MGNKAIHRAVSGTLMAKSETDGERQAICESMYATYRKGFSRTAVNDLSAAELLALMDDTSAEVVLVDCREDSERKVSTIKGSMSQEEFDGLLAQGWTPKEGDNRHVVCFCTIGYRSGVFANKVARRTGHSPIHNLAGSLLLWAHAGGGLVDAEGNPTDVLHVYGPAWDLAPRRLTTVVNSSSNDGQVKVLTVGIETNHVAYGTGESGGEGGNGGSKDDSGHANERGPVVDNGPKPLDQEQQDHEQER